MNKDSIISALVFGGGGGSALPDVAGNAGKVLKVNSGGTGTEWGDVPNELPAIASGDAGKVLQVNSGHTGVEWGSIPNELPTIGSGDAGKILKVSSGGTGVEWGEQGSVNLYLHSIKIGSSPIYGYATIINKTSTAYTTQTLANLLQNMTINSKYLGIAPNATISTTDNVTTLTTGYGALKPLSSTQLTVDYIVFTITDGIISNINKGSMNYVNISDSVRSL